MKSALILATLGLLVSGVSSSGNSYGGGAESGGSSYGSEGNYAAGGYDDAAAGHAANAVERPRVNLGISLKVPAMKINLGRMNMPRISIRAKIKQSHAPKVINVPEMHIDTNSKIPGPAGAQAAGGDYGPSGSPYGQGSTSQSYGPTSSGYEGQYAAAEGGYSAADPAPAAGPYEVAHDNGSYETSAPSSDPHGRETAQGAGYGGAPSYEQASSYSSSKPLVATAAYLNESPPPPAPPTNYGRKPYGDAPPPAHMNGGYGPSSPSNYGGSSLSYGQPAAPLNADYPRAPIASTRHTYGSSAQAYGAPPQQYQSIAYGAAKQKQSYGQHAATGSYQQTSYGTLQARPQQQQQQQQYQLPAVNGNGQQQYSSAAPPTAYGAAAVGGDSYKSAPRVYSQPAPAYGSGPGMGSGSLGYQPLEPGHTLLTASNDNYDGLTQLAVASNPPKEPPKYYGSGSTSAMGISYGQQQRYSQQPSYASTSSSYAPASSSSSYAPPKPMTTYGGANQYTASAQYQQPQKQSYQSVSQPVYDDSASSYTQIDQGSYGARMEPASGAYQHQQAPASYVEAY